MIRRNPASYCVAACLAAACWAPAAGAQQAHLSAAELKSTVVGKKIEHERLSDKRIFIWDVRDSGTLFIVNSSLKGKWAIKDNGEICIEWEVNRVPDACYFFYQGSGGMTAGPSKTPGVMTSNVKSIK